MSVRLHFPSVLCVAALHISMAISACGADWPMLGGSVSRNPVSTEKNPPTDWDVETGRNIRWKARLGSMTHGTPVVADGQVYIGTNNGASYLKRFPNTVDLGALLCFRESDGAFLWQYSATKLPTGRLHDWPLQGIGSSPLVEGDRLWFVSNRWEVVCLDAKGFRDGENDGLVTDERVEDKREADVVWRLDMIGELGVSPYSQGMGPSRRCSPAASYQDRIYVHTGNGVDHSHFNVPTPNAPSLVCLDKNTGRVLWTDNSPGANVLHGEFSSPLVADIGGRAQVIAAQGDGWIRSFDAISGKLLWKFDVNLKESKWILGGRGRRNHVLATPVLYRNRIYVAVGQEVEHGEGIGRLLCIDPTKSGDISSELAVDADGKPIPHRRLQAVNSEEGERAILNPNSGVIWEFTSEGDEFEDSMHRTISSVAVHNGLLIAADFAGLTHCFDADNGRRHWSYDCFAAGWSAPLIVDDRVYVADEDGDMAIFALSPDPAVAMKNKDEPLAEINLGNAIHGSPVFANGTLYVATRNMLLAIAGTQPESARAERPGGGTIRANSDPRRIRLPKLDASIVGGDKTAKPADDPRRIVNSVYSPTPHDVVDRMLALGRVQKDDLVIDLGSGDGRIVIAAAEKYGCRAVGYEADANLIRLSKENSRSANVADRVTFHQADLFTGDLSKASVVTLYLLPVQNRRLIPQLKKLPAGARIVCHQYDIPGADADRVIRVASEETGESHYLFLYTAPLKVKD